MSINFKTTRKEYEISDESGYTFRIVAEWEIWRGWSASVTIVQRGMNSSNEALNALREPLRHLLILLDDHSKPEDNELDSDEPLIQTSSLKQIIVYDDCGFCGGSHPAGEGCPRQGDNQSEDMHE